MKLKIPKLTIKRPAFLTRKPMPSKPVKLQAATARMRAEDEFDDEPQTRLSSAFFVVLILHVVAVGGIYAFNSIKAHRRGLEPSSASTAAKPAIEKSTPGEAATAKTASAPLQASKPISEPSAASSLATVPISSARLYRVKSGDTLTKVSQQFGFSVAALQFANPGVATLHAGQTLNLPAKTAPSPAATETLATNALAKKTDAPSIPKLAATTTATTYEVKAKDTATSIAKRYNVSVEDLLKVNKISDPTKLQLGAKLAIPAKKN